MKSMTALANALTAGKPREKAGAKTGSRYAFQAHVSLAKILDLHASAVDFRALFDHFDDLMILCDSSESPVSADFFQIKGKQSGAWTGSQLAHPKGDAPRTIVGKMYYRTLQFGSSVSSCRFVSNAPFQFILSDGRTTTPDDGTIEFGSLGPNDQNRLRGALDLDFAPPRSFDEATILKFERTPVPLTAYEVFLKGHLVELLSNDNSATVSGLYRLLINEITKRANDSTECADLADVFTHKSLCRNDLRAAIEAAETRRSVLDNWSIVDEELKTEGRSTMERVRLRTAAIVYVQARAKHAPGTSEFRLAAQNAAEAHMSKIKCAATMIAAGNLLASVTFSPPNSPYADNEAAFLVEAFEAIYE